MNFTIENFGANRIDMYFIFAIIAGMVLFLMVYRSLLEDRTSKISKILAGIVAGTLILYNIYTPLKMILYTNSSDHLEYLGYQVVEIFHYKDFNELQNTETVSEHTKIRVYPNPTYPDDKIVELSRGDQKIKAFVENNNGTAKVVDIIINGRQVVFK
jgi:hypothetical protein